LTCYHPLRWYEGPVKEVGKVNVVHTLRESECGKELNLPCGRCVGCLMSRAKSWAIRCSHEASLYDDNCFVTLTFDQDHLPFDRSLDVADIQCFMKRLRKAFGEGIRYFACGEYGSLNLRPHYHVLLFNHDFHDKVLFKESEAGSPVYISADLQKLWPYGFSSLSDVTYKSAAYVARYNLKKALGHDDIPSELRKEFVVMSRGSKKLGTGGIGKGWFDKFKGDVFPSDEVILPDGNKVKPPRFYDKLLDKTDPDLLESIKAKRKLQGSKMVTVEVGGKTILVNDNDSFRLPVKEEVFRAGLSRLKRGLEVS